MYLIFWPIQLRIFINYHIPCTKIRVNKNCKIKIMSLIDINIINWLCIRVNILNVRNLLIMVGFLNFLI